MEVAKIDSNNIVVATMIVKTEKCLSNNGAVTDASCQAFCENLFGAGFTYKSDILTNNKPDVGKIYDADKNAYHEGKPSDIEGNECTSWVWNTEHFKWHAPHMWGPMDGLKKIQWRESNSRWYAKPAGEADGNWLTWNNTSSTWEDTGSSTL